MVAFPMRKEEEHHQRKVRGEMVKVTIVKASETELKKQVRNLLEGLRRERAM